MLVNIKNYYLFTRTTTSSKKAAFLILLNLCFYVGQTVQSTGKFLTKLRQLWIQKKYYTTCCVSEKHQILEAENLNFIRFTHIGSHHNWHFCFVYGDLRLNSRPGSQLSWGFTPFKKHWAVP